MAIDARPPADGDPSGSEWLPDRPDAGRLIRQLARDDPGAALSALRSTVGARDYVWPASRAEDRREVACALADIARAPEHFGEAARILIRLAAAEDGTAQNGAGAIFAGLFVNMPSAASAGAGAGERTALLAELLDGGDGRFRLLALSACDAALRTHSIVRADCEGGRPAALSGCIVGKEFDAYRKTLELLTSRLGRMEHDESLEAAGIILERAEDLSRHRETSCEAAGAVRMVYEMRLADRENLAKTAKAAAECCARRADERGAAAWGSLLADMSGGAGSAARVGPPGARPGGGAGG